MNSNEEEGEMSNCVQPDAPWVPCVICGKPVKTCEREEPVEDDSQLVGYDYICPEHPDGCELSSGLGWVCSFNCDSVADRRLQPAHEREPVTERAPYDWTNGGRDCIGCGMECCAGCGEDGPPPDEPERAGAWIRKDKEGER